MVMDGSSVVMDGSSVLKGDTDGAAARTEEDKDMTGQTHTVRSAKQEHLSRAAREAVADKRLIRIRKCSTPGHALLLSCLYDLDDALVAASSISVVVVQ